MAKINVEFDTVAKTLVVTMDGKQVENVVGISAFKAYSYDMKEDEEAKFSISVHKSEEDEDNEVHTYTTIMANEITRGEEDPLTNYFMNKFGGR